MTAFYLWIYKILRVPSFKLTMRVLYTMDFSVFPLLYTICMCPFSSLHLKMAGLFFIEMGTHLEKSMEAG